MKYLHSVGVLSLALAFIPSAWAAGNSALAEVQKQYKQERAHCLSGQSHQDRATCLKEAGAAYDEARRGALNNKTTSNYSQNAAERCNAQPPADRDACIQRVTGAGTTEGSVKGGGLIRQSETKVR